MFRGHKKGIACIALTILMIIILGWGSTYLSRCEAREHGSASTISRERHHNGEHETKELHDLDADFTW